MPSPMRSKRAAWPSRKYSRFPSHRPTQRPAARRASTQARKVRCGSVSIPGKPTQTSNTSPEEEPVGVRMGGGGGLQSRERGAPMGIRHEDQRRGREPGAASGPATRRGLPGVASPAGGRSRRTRPGLRPGRRPPNRRGRNRDPDEALMQLVGYAIEGHGGQYQEVAAIEGQARAVCRRARSMARARSAEHGGVGDLVQGRGQLDPARVVRLRTQPEDRPGHGQGEEPESTKAHDLSKHRRCGDANRPCSLLLEPERSDLHMRPRPSRRRVMDLFSTRPVP